MAKSTRGAVFKALPKRFERAQAEAEKAVTRGVKATLELLPAGPRKSVRALGGQLEDAATDIRARGRQALRGVEKRGNKLVGQVERTVAQLEKRGTKALKRAERERSRWLSALEAGATRIANRVTSTLDLATASDVARLSKRLAMLERKVGGHTTRSRAA
ncbi:MAG: hypothetical protein ABI629_04930 [bacterium]